MTDGMIREYDLGPNAPSTREVLFVGDDVYALGAPPAPASPDQPAPPEVIIAASDGRRFVVEPRVGVGCHLVTSSDGLAWEPVPGGDCTAIERIGVGPKGFAVVGRHVGARDGSDLFTVDPPR